ncbi:DUF4192 domain-containing protein [Jatrophihabitans telluris]|uniref:DUF4192 domain-containing protein n=1 Tax=Jatrophihabitans telluris TaxID=2038343 RepID=A0ABY4QTB9_9ACTN|nr:DUF4192 domain-containing protein [Jatrophihabitans telluris]UQX86723.1 DUF4192 domain-containing protein [Jatrophihabitans telluris]
MQPQRGRAIPTAALATAADVIDIVPYLLGFHPVESIVIVGLSERNGRAPQVCLTARCDLPPAPMDPGAFSPLVAPLASTDSDCVVALVFTHHHPAASGDVPQHLHDVALACALVGLSVVDLLVVGQERWWSLTCTDSGCCSPGGNERRSTSASAEAVFAGLVALPDREAVRGQLAGQTRHERDRLEPALAKAENRLTEAVLKGRLSTSLRADLRAFTARLDRHPTEGTAGRAMTRAELARFGVALTHVEVRDELWFRVDERSVDADDALLELLRRLPPPYDAVPLLLFAWSQWRKGNGTLATMAGERALDSDPGLSAARVVLDTVQLGLNPARTPPLRSPSANVGTQRFG